MRGSNPKLGTFTAVAAIMGLAAALIQPVPEAFAQQPAMGSHGAPTITRSQI